MLFRSAPDWEVLIVDEQGLPLENMTVRLNYQNYSAEPEGHELEATTDARGQVHFPKQTTRTSIGSYILNTAWSATAGVHASFGRHAYVFTFGRGRDGSATTGDYITDWTGSPDEMKSRIVAEPRALSTEPRP